jgi:very-short-patch-repair endonuclease
VTTTFVIAFILIAILTWMVVYPRDAMKLLAALKRHLRRHITQRTGNQAAKELARRLHRFARQEGIDPDLVDQVIEEYQQVIIDRLGTKHADHVMGEPGPSERFF